MAKANQKNQQPSEADLRKAFQGWRNALEGMEEKAEKSYMPILAKVFNLGQDVLKIYEDAFLSIHKNSKNK